MSETIILRGLKDMETFGKEFSKNLNPGSVIALVGPLGAGKTTLTQSIARGLGISEKLTSPTFTIIQEYESGRLPLYHFDVYRVYDPEELFEMGFEDYLRRDGVCIIEWADLIEDMLPEDTIRINLDYTENEGERSLIIC